MNVIISKREIGEDDNVLAERKRNAGPDFCRRQIRLWRTSGPGAAFGREKSQTRKVKNDKRECQGEAINLLN